MSDAPEITGTFAPDGSLMVFQGSLEAGVEVFMIGTLDLLGHLIELYEPSEPVMGFFKTARDAPLEPEPAPLLCGT